MLRTVSLLFLAGAAALPAADPLKTLFVTGGTSHNYHVLAPLITAGMAQFANIAFTVKMCDKAEQLVAVMKDPKLGEGYDAIVYDMCYAGIADDDLVANAKRVTSEGKPTVMLHCAMHCFWKDRKDSSWGECCGLYTNYHEHFAPFAVTPAEPRSPIVKFWPASWQNEGDELYHNVTFPFPGATSSIGLLSAKDPKGQDQVVAWTHDFGKGKVFGTTLGHDVKSASKEEYFHLCANGLLWVAGKLGDDGQPVAGYEGTGAKK